MQAVQGNIIDEPVDTVVAAVSNGKLQPDMGAAHALFVQGGAEKMRHMINGWYNKTGDVPVSECAYTNSTERLHP